MIGVSGDQFILTKPIDEGLFAKPLSGLTVRIDPTRAAKPFALLDCHDQSLRASGRVLIETGGALQLLQNDQAPLAQRGKGQGRFVQDLPKGPVQAALNGFPELRAFMQIGNGEIEVKSLTVLDELQKTQVKGTIWCMSSPTGQVTLVRLQQLRGYERAYQKISAALADMSVGEQGIQALYVGLYPDMDTYQAKPEIKLGTTEPSIEVAADIIHTYFKVARQNEEGVIADIDTEFLHDYRVSLRKIRSVVSLFKGVFSEDQTAELKRVFSDLMAPTGRVRDLDVYLLEKDKYFNLIPPSLHPGLQQMFDRFQKERMQEQFALVSQVAQ